MNTSNENSRRQLAIAAGAWAILIGVLIAAGTSWLGLDAGDVLEAAVFGAVGAAICIWFFAGDIIAMADRLRRPGPRSMK
jgi:hypothetical protein